jgi:two-component system, OmpR family, response regulator
MSPLRALVIDDQEHIRDLVADFLKLLGFEVDTAGTGAEGLTAATENRYAVVLADYTLPETRGLDLVDGIRHLQPTVPLVVMTGQVDPAILADLERNAYSVLSKPFSLTDLAARLREFGVPFTASPDL